MQKQEETKQERSQQALGHEETGQGQLGKRLEGTPEGEGVCVQGRGRNRLDWNEQARFLCWGVDLPVLETECESACRYVPTDSSVRGGGRSGCGLGLSPSLSL